MSVSAISRATPLKFLLLDSGLGKCEHLINAKYKQAVHLTMHSLPYFYGLSLQCAERDMGPDNCAGTHFLLPMITSGA